MQVMPRGKTGEGSNVVIPFQMKKQATEGKQSLINQKQ